MFPQRCMHSLVAAVLVAGAPQEQAVTPALRSRSALPPQLVAGVAERRRSEETASSSHNTEVQELRKKIAEERKWTEILGYAAGVVRKNATSQELKRKRLESELVAIAGANNETVKAAEDKADKVQEGNLQLEEKIKEVERRTSMAAARAKAADEKAAAPPQADADLGPPAAAVRGWMDLLQSLRDCPSQMGIAAVVGGLGLLSCRSPVAFYEALTVGIIGVFSGVAGAAEAKASWGDELAPWMQLLVGVEAACIAAAAAVAGFAGLRTLIGSALGALVAHVWRPPTISDMEPLWFAECIAVGGILFLWVGRREAGVVFGAVFGGLLVASAVVYASQNAFGEATNFLDFTSELLVGTRHSSHLASCAGAAVGVVVAFVGIVRGLHLHHRHATPTAGVVEPVRPPARSSGSLQQIRTPLLEPSEVPPQQNVATAAAAYLAPLPNARGNTAPPPHETFAQPPQGTPAAAKPSFSDRWASIAGSPQVQQMQAAIGDIKSGKSTSSSARVPPPPAPPRRGSQDRRR